MKGPAVDDISIAGKEFAASALRKWILSILKISPYFKVLCLNGAGSCRAVLPGRVPGTREN
jgi:hypothetical protein